MAVIALMALSCEIVFWCSSLSGLELDYPDHEVADYGGAHRFDESVCRSGRDPQRSWQHDEDGKTQCAQPASPSKRKGSAGYGNDE